MVINVLFDVFRGNDVAVVKALRVLRVLKPLQVLARSPGMQVRRARPGGFWFASP